MCCKMESLTSKQKRDIRRMLETIRTSAMNAIPVSKINQPTVDAGAAKMTGLTAKTIGIISRVPSEVNDITWIKAGIAIGYFGQESIRAEVFRNGKGHLKLRTTVKA